MQHKGEYIWALVGRLVPMIIYLGTTMVLARFLTPNDFGMVGVLSMFFMIARTLMDAGLGGSLIKEKEITDLDCSTIFVFNIVVSIVLYSLIFIFANTLENYFDVPGLNKVVKILCSVFIINSFGLVPFSLLTRNLQFRTITIVNIISVICASIVAIILALFKWGVYALVAYQLVNAFVIVVLSYKPSKFRPSLRFSIDSLRRLLPFGIFTTLTTTIDTIYENLTTFLFGKYLNMQQAGYLSQAKRLEEVPSQSVVQTITQVAFPVLNKLRDKENEFAEECTNTFKTVMLLILPLMVVLSIFSEPIVLLVFGKQWSAAAPYLSLLVFAAIFHIAETLNRTFIKSTTRVHELFKYTLLKRIIGIVIIFIFLYIKPLFALYGYILSTFIGYAINVFLLSRISNLTIISQLKVFIISLLPNLLIYIILISIHIFLESLVLEIVIGILLLIFYFFYILRLYKIDIISFIFKFIKK